MGDHERVWHKTLFGNRGLITPLIRYRMNSVIANMPIISISECVVAENPELLAEIENFRLDIFCREKPAFARVLNEKAKLEKQIDRRSYHFIARCSEGHMIGAVRMTPFPFEMALMTDAFDAYQAEIKHKLEINRLVVHPDYRDLGIGKKLNYAAFLKFSRSTKYTGFAAICRTDKQASFERLGMTAINKSPLVVPERGDSEYAVLSGQWSANLAQIFKRYALKHVKSVLTGGDLYKEKQETKDVESKCLPKT